MPPPFVWAALRVGRYAWYFLSRERRHQLSQYLKHRMPRQRRALWLGAGSGLVLYTHLDTVPVSDRRRLLWLSDREVMAIDQLVEEAEQESFQEALAISSPNAKVVQEVLLNIIDHSPELQGRPWRIHLSADEAFNAFSFHSGTVYLTMGLCRELHSRSELACILGHEMAHVVAKHSYERFTVANMFTAGYHALFWVMAIAFPDMAMSFSAFAFNEVAMPMLIGPLTVKLPFERSQEYEADYIGTVFASRAGYDPGAFVGLAERQAKRDREDDPEADAVHECFRTHPLWMKRKDRILAHLDELQAIRTRSLEESPVLAAYHARHRVALQIHPKPWTEFVQRLFLQRPPAAPVQTLFA